MTDFKPPTIFIVAHSSKHAEAATKGYNLRRTAWKFCYGVDALRGRRGHPVLFVSGYLARRDAADLEAVVAARHHAFFDMGAAIEHATNPRNAYR